MDDRAAERAEERRQDEQMADARREREFDHAPSIEVTRYGAAEIELRDRCDSCHAPGPHEHRSALNGWPLCDGCWDRQVKLRRGFNERRSVWDREADMQALRDGCNPFA